MTQAAPDVSRTEATATDTVLSVDAMGGDNGPATVVAGLARFLDKRPDAKAILHGPQADVFVSVQQDGNKKRFRAATRKVDQRGLPQQFLQRP